MRVVVRDAREEIFGANLAETFRMMTDVFHRDLWEFRIRHSSTLRGLLCCPLDKLT